MIGVALLHPMRPVAIAANAVPCRVRDVANDLQLTVGAMQAMLSRNGFGWFDAVQSPTGPGERGSEHTGERADVVIKTSVDDAHGSPSPICALVVEIRVGDDFSLVEPGSTNFFSHSDSAHFPEHRHGRDRAIDSPAGARTGATRALTQTKKRSPPSQ
jgi:hypothetical protein